MLATEKELQESWKKIGKTRVSASKLISTTPAFIFSITIVGKDNKNSIAKVHDSQSTDSNYYEQIQAVMGDSKQFIFNPPLCFRHGIYYEASSDFLYGSIQYLPIKE